MPRCSISRPSGIVSMRQPVLKVMQKCGVKRIKKSFLVRFLRLVYVRRGKPPWETREPL